MINAFRRERYADLFSIVKCEISRTTDFQSVDRHRDFDRDGLEVRRTGLWLRFVRRWVLETGLAHALADKPTSATRHNGGVAGVKLL